MSPDQSEAFLISCFGYTKAGCCMLLKMLELADTEDYIATLQEDYLIGPRKPTEDQSMALVKFVQFTGRSYERCVMIFKSFKNNLHTPDRAFMDNGCGGGIGNVVPYEHKVLYVKERVNFLYSSFSCSQSIFFDTILSHTNNI